MEPSKEQFYPRRIAEFEKHNGELLVPVSKLFMRGDSGKTRSIEKGVIRWLFGAGPAVKVDS